MYKNSLCTALLGGFLFFSVGLFCFSSCTDVDSLPEGILPKQAMVDVLVDIHIAESFVSNTQMSAQRTDKLFGKYEDVIFEKYGISDQQYQESHRYYLNHLEKFQDIYKVVVDSLDVRKSRIAPPPKIDTR